VHRVARGAPDQQRRSAWPARDRLELGIASISLTTDRVMRTLRAVAEIGARRP
jgi:hypothetical protein